MPRDWLELRSQIVGERQWQAAADRHQARTVGVMRSHHGYRQGHICRECKHLVKVLGYETTNVYYKCERFKVSSSVSTDWRCRYPACGLFEEREAVRA